MSDTNKIVGGAREWWITQTLVSYAIGQPVYRVSDEKPDEHDCRMAAAIYRVVEYSAYNELVDTHVNMRRILNAELESEREKLAICIEALERMANDPSEPSLGSFNWKGEAIRTLKKIKDLK